MIVLPPPGCYCDYGDIMGTLNGTEHFAGCKWADKSKPVDRLGNIFEQLPDAPRIPDPKYEKKSK